MDECCMHFVEPCITKSVSGNSATLPGVFVVTVYTWIRLMSCLSPGQVPHILTEICVVFFAVS